jgi:hypothetical protein
MHSFIPGKVGHAQALVASIFSTIPFATCT